jgi:hypothetical protein
MPDTILEPPPHAVPVVFTPAPLDWLPWLIAPGPPAAVMPRVAIVDRRVS